MVNWKVVGVGILGLAVIGGAITVLVVALTPSTDSGERDDLVQERDDLQKQLDALKFSTPEARQPIEDRIREINNILFNQ